MPRDIGSYLKDVGIDLSQIDRISDSGVAGKSLAERIQIHRRLKNSAGTFVEAKPISLYDFIKQTVLSQFPGDNTLPTEKSASPKFMVQNTETLKKEREHILDEVGKVVEQNEAEHDPRKPKGVMNDNDPQMILFNVKRLKDLKNKLMSLTDAHEAEMVYGVGRAQIDRNLVSACIPDFVMSYKGKGSELLREDINIQRSGQKRFLLINSLTSHSAIAKEFRKGEYFDKYVINADDSLSEIMSKLNTQQKAKIPCLFEDSTKICNGEEAINKIYGSRNIQDAIKLFEFVNTKKLLSSKENIAAFYESLSKRQDMNAEKLKDLFVYLASGKGKEYGLTKKKILSSFYKSLSHNSTLKPEDLSAIFSFSYEKNGKTIPIDREKCANAIQESLKNRDDILLGDFAKFLEEIKRQGLSIKIGRNLLEQSLKGGRDVKLGQELKKLVSVTDEVQVLLSKLSSPGDPKDPDARLKYFKDLDKSQKEFNSLYEGYHKLEDTLRKLQLGSKKSKEKYSSLLDLLLSPNDRKRVEDMRMTLELPNVRGIAKPLEQVIQDELKTLQEASSKPPIPTPQQEPTQPEQPAQPTQPPMAAEPPQEPAISPKAPLPHGPELRTFTLSEDDIKEAKDRLEARMAETARIQRESEDAKRKQAEKQTEFERSYTAAYQNEVKAQEERSWKKQLERAQDIQAKEDKKRVQKISQSKEFAKKFEALFPQRFGDDYGDKRDTTWKFRRLKQRIDQLLFLDDIKYYLSILKASPDKSVDKSVYSAKILYAAMHLIYTNLQNESRFLPRSWGSKSRLELVLEDKMDKLGKLLLSSNAVQDVDELKNTSNTRNLEKFANQHALGASYDQFKPPEPPSTSKAKPRK